MRSLFYLGVGFCYNVRMELSEKWLQKFEDEGFASVYEWSDPAGTVYDPHHHKGRVSIFVLDGSCVFNFNGKETEVRSGMRFDVPSKSEHSAIVGPEGWNIVVGEEIEGDS